MNIDDFLQNLEFEIYTLTQEADIYSNDPIKVKKQNGLENKLTFKSTWLGTYKVQPTNYIKLEQYFQKNLFRSRDNGLSYFVNETW